MIKIRWQLEEAVALYDLYFRNGEKFDVSIDEIENLSRIYRMRAEKLGFTVDEKFRNVSGLRMQLGCIHYVVTAGREGLSNASKLFYKTYELYIKEPKVFNRILNEFYEKYDA